jgi:hypothetical protein
MNGALAPFNEPRRMGHGRFSSFEARKSAHLRMTREGTLTRSNRGAEADAGFVAGPDRDAGAAGF